MSIDLNYCTKKILEFHSSPIITRAIDAELKFNRCMYDLIANKETLVFMISSWRRPGNVYIRALGSTMLEEDILFEITSHPMYEVLSSGKKAVLPTRTLPEQLLKRIALKMKTVPSDFCCVPFVPLEHAPCILYCLLTPGKRCECVDEAIVDHMLRHCGNTLSLAFLYQEQVRLYKQSRDLLTVAERLFQNLADVSHVLSVVMHEGQKLVKAERCSLFQVDRKEGTLISKVCDGLDGKEIKLSMNMGIAGHVSSTGELMNVCDAYRHPLFYPKIDEISGFRTRNILCVPILYDGKVIAVAELCNKIGQSCFTEFDEEIAGPFAIFCGISIQHTNLYEKLLVEMARHKLTNELMIYHFKQEVSLEEKMKITECKLDHNTTFKYQQFSCSPVFIDEEHLICIILEMFDDLGILQQFSIPKLTLTRWILFMKRGYRDNPYHCWFHAFSVTHFGYLLIHEFHLIEKGYINLLEALAFLVACVGHDVDHRGTTSSFQNVAGTALASLYSSQGSVMERHHFQQTMCVLHMEDCNIFEHLNKEEYGTCVDIIKEVILATDLTTRIRIRQKQEEAFKRYNKEDEEHKRLLLSIMVTSADLSMQTKDWCSIRRTAKGVYEEYFSQGDLEIAFGSQPCAFMNRRNANIPQQQIEFLNRIVIPVFETLRTLFSEAAPLVDSLHLSVKRWTIAAPVFERRLRQGQEALHILGDAQFANEVMDLLEGGEGGVAAGAP